ncbi:MAG: ABC-type lipoprotein release transport system permease subunit [Myxococcota bacterium]|jgi:ABC-type lipoprotein release transport system permease subunit
MLVFRIATRNLFRQFRRNVLSMVSIIMGVFVIVAGRGFQNGLNENMIRAQIDSGSGHVMAVPADYPTKGFRQPVADAFPLPDATRTWLDEHTTAWTPRIVAAPRAIKGLDSMKVRLYGVASSDETVFPRKDWAIDGALPADGEVLMGKSPARLLGVEPGDLVTFELRTVDGALNAMRYPVSGILTTGSPMIDNISAFATLPTVDALVAANGRVTHVSTRVGNRNKAEAFAPELAAALPGTDIRTWVSEVAPMIEAQEVRQTMFDIIGLALLLMAATGIANTVLMAAYERTREIGTLRSMGLQRGGVLAMFALEGFWMGVVGGAVGATLGGLLTYHYSINGIDLVSMMAGKAEAMDNIPMAATLYLQFSPTTLVVAFVVGIVVSMLASVYPAIAASRISPAEAVRAA